jgi:Ca2+-binding RTX toxin-like protein
VITWGDASSGGDSSVYHYDDATSTYVKDDSVASQLDGTIDVKQIFSNDYAFAALRVDGSVITWGDASSGGDSNAVTKQLDGTIDVKQIFSNGSSFAALRVDGSVITWGDASTGTGGDSSVTHVGYSTSLDIIKDYSVTKQLDGTIDVTQIFSTDYAFSALRSDGSVITWGDASSGGDSSAVTKKLNGTIDVTQIFSNDYAFAALRVDGSVVTWGDAFYGGDSSAVTKQLDGTIDVTQIYSNGRAFAALRVDGSVVTWGDDLSGGDSSVYHYDDAKSTVIKDYSVTKQLDGTIDVKQIYSNGYAFAALRVDGSVVTWGYYENSTQIPNKLNGVVSFADPSTDDIYKISTVTHSTITTSEDDVITGTSGRDTINGGLGNDTLTGGLGSDKFVFNTTLNAKTNVDTITDFVHDIDQIQLAKSIMTNIGNVGNINASTFTLSTQSLTAANRIIYDLSLGALSYDADGSGSIPAIQFAIIGVSTHPILSNTDFVIV